LYEQLYENIKEDIVSGRLQKNTVLKSLRVMGKELNVSRNTVDRAYQQLIGEGYIYSVQGAGYFVEDIGNDCFCDPYPYKRTTEVLDLAKKLKPRYDFEYTSIDASLFPWPRWKRATQNALLTESNYSVLAYESNKGNLKLRKSLCGYLYRHRGVQCKPEQIIVTSGTQFAMGIVADLFPPRQNSVAYEEPGYDAMRHLLIAKGYEISPIPVLENGVDINALNKTDCTLLYITPSHQFPTGIVTSINTRYKLLKWAYENNNFIIENDYDSEFRYGLMPIPSMQSLSWNQNIIYIGTLSKIMSPSIRCAYLVLPEKLADAYDEKYKYFNSALPSYHQMAIAEFIDEGLLEKHLRKISKINEKKYFVLTETIKEFLADEVEFFQSPAGVHTLVRIKRCKDQDKLIQDMRAASVGIYGIKEHFYDQKNAREDIFLMGFNSMTEKDIREGCSRIAGVLNKMN
jgi:GntR family transcriptional regulator/MocR family aminotransferase